MSVEIWPHIAPDQLKIEEDATQARELSWFLASLRTTLRSLKRGLEDSYALLAPIDPGSTLVLSTPRNETVKGHVTRVGTRLVKGTVHLRLRTLPPQTLSLDPGRPIRIAPLVALNTLLTESIDLVGFCVEEDDDGGDEGAAAAFLSSQLRLLAQHLAEAFALIKGSNALASPPPPAGSDERGRDPTTTTTTTTTTSSRSHLFSPRQPPSTSAAVAAAAAISGPWTRSSVPLGHFAPPLSRNLSFYLTVQDASLVLYLRALEPAGAPMNFGAKLAFAIGTARRLEHDEADRVFAYRCDDDMDNDNNNNNQHQHHHQQQQQLDVPKEEDDNNRNRTSNDDDVHLSVAAPRSSSSRRRPVSAGSGGSHATSVSLGSSFGFGGGGGGSSSTSGDGRNMSIGQGGEVEVYVREKVRVESADPSLLSLSAKLGALANTLSLARRNLAAVMGEEFEDQENYVV